MLRKDNPVVRERFRLSISVQAGSRVIIVVVQSVGPSDCGFNKIHSTIANFMQVRKYFLSVENFE